MESEDADGTPISTWDTDNGEADDDKADGEADVNATSTMMLSRHVTQSQINQNNHWNEELDRDGGDSCEKGSLAAAFDVQMGCKMGCNNSKEDNVDGNNNNNNKNNDDELHVGMQDGYYYKDGTQVEEATTYPNPPQEYPPTDNNKSKLGEPSWHDIHNPGTWNHFCYRSKFEKGFDGRYMYHKLPSGCTPQNWVPEEDTPIFSHRYTSSRDLFPQERKCELDMAKLRKHGLQLGRVLNSDAIFFFQLLLPFHTDEEDEKQENKMQQKPFYFEVSNYANQPNTGKEHYVKIIKLSELIHFDGIVYLHGALEGKKGSICYRWTKVGVLYSPKIATKMSWYRWRQIKSNLKLNCNHEAKYNRLLCKDDMSNSTMLTIHFFSKKACSDLCLDESSWAYYGFGGPMVDYLKGKTFSRGGQMAPALQKTNTPQYVQDIFTKYVIPEIGKLWSSPPRLTADNFFNWLGFGMIGTVAQNRLPKTVEDKYFHKENLSSASAKRCLRIARLCNPITMVKEVPACAEAGRFTKGYRHIHCSFQSTGACNIGSVNSLDLNGFFLDQIDSVILRSNIGYKSWKYYHAPINHAKALTVLTAFDIQQLDFRQFKQKLAEEMLTYNPSDKAYPVGALLREVTQSSMKQRLVSDRRRSCAYSFGGIILNYHCLETVFESKLKGRFCSEVDTEEYKKHHKSLSASKWKNRRNCYMCGAGCYTVCEKCVFGKKFVPLCKGDCFADYHSYKYFGLAKEGLGKVVYG
eukprot:jgi/Psemu1/13658/gm1.13658_g